MSHVLILGAGHAGGSVAALLRQYGFDGAITLVGDEPIAPYQRPPLSKAWLKGEADAESLALRPESFYGEQGISLRLGVSAVRIRRSIRLVVLSDGSETAYDKLIIATGARPIELPIDGADLAGVHALRTAADAEALKASLGPGKTVVVVGAGYVGLEVAASSRALGAEVVVVEREPRLLARVACEALSTFFRDYHAARGVAFRVGATAIRFLGARGRVVGVELADGERIACDAVVVGVGVHPNDELARDAGLACARGVAVDLDARSVTDPDVFAIGDVAHRPMPIYDRMLRMESVPNALEQAKQAACAITGRPRPAGECPWQWSDQYDLKLQIAGYAFDVDEVIVRGEPASGQFSVFHLKGEVVQSVEAINAPPDFMMGKQLILSRRPVDKARLRDTRVPIREVLA